MLELLNNLKERKPFHVIYDGDDFGIYKYNEEKERYEGAIGHLKLKDMLEIIKNKEHFIKLEVIKWI